MLVKDKFYFFVFAILPLVIGIVIGFAYSVDKSQLVLNISFAVSIILAFMLVVFQLIFNKTTLTMNFLKCLFLFEFSLVLGISVVIALNQSL
jgi:low affinity Fe/Cu permease